ncbi:YeeE/YedE family protein [Sediminicurvatus halobius]|uniref:Uncharacterized protein n=1 Tax=Sediminicurvatus halobius TaxID=2182432 RepID=A0A2U2N9I5_9GAMM|nr:YeeE/YedE family protein [Spiribacter halobius]PWG65758.1 hypothetical protein DEM34_00355 [Spiribacter halobius]UEX77795.1 YeeE/YedE family protein [Spiribacter halobius]
MASVAPHAATRSMPAGLTAGMDRFVIATVAVFAFVLAGLLWWQAPADRVLLFLIGGGLGVALYHAAFGFTAGWRNFVVHRRSGGLRAQLLLIGIASVLFAPVLAAGAASGFVAPVGLWIVAGSFLFGLGMQLGGGCGSGTLFTVGAGNRRMLITLAFFIVGSVLGTLHLPWWLEGPGIGAVSLIGTLDPLGAVLIQLAVLGALGVALMEAERARHGNVQRSLWRGPERGAGATLLTGGWPLLWGALALALLNLATLLVSGTPWGITFAFALWGAKGLSALGVDVAQWEYWTWPYPAQALSASVLNDVTSVMDFGLILGAMLAAGLAGRYNAGSQRRLGARSVAGAVLGGLLMGYGARLAFGCNIGAMFSGIASASLHGWVWFVFAFLGSLLGIRLRPRFGLEN